MEETTGPSSRFITLADHAMDGSRKYARNTVCAVRGKRANWEMMCLEKGTANTSFVMPDVDVASKPGPDR